MRGLALRSHYWGALVVVVASGELDPEGAGVLGSHLQKVQRGSDVVVDLWDITRCGPEGIATLKAARERSTELGWGFAVVADPEGPCVEAIAAEGVKTRIETFADRYAARQALRF